MGRVLILLSVLLIAFHAQCVVACTLLPCGDVSRQTTPAPEPPCHHQDSAPAPDSHDSQACGHSQFVSEDGGQMAAPAVALESFELVPVGLLAEPAFVRIDEPAALSPPPPLRSPSLSRAVLRV